VRAPLDTDNQLAFFQSTTSLVLAKLFVNGAGCRTPGANAAELR
jgi:hypothetical protein